jgi:hypothetical protein
VKQANHYPQIATMITPALITYLKQQLRDIKKSTLTNDMLHIKVQGKPVSFRFYYDSTLEDLIGEINLQLGN